MKVNKYCKCEVCEAYFDVTGKQGSKFCSQKCRQKDYRIRNGINKGIGNAQVAPNPS